MPPTKAIRATRSDGERTRREILTTAARLATVEGIRHLSIARLADEVGISKSGLYAHFGSKQELQLATIDTAEEIYERDVYDAIAPVPAGHDGAIALADAHLDHMRRRVFPGGCFFDAAAGDLALERGIVRDKVAAFQAGWVARLRTNLEAAVTKGELPADADLVQILYDITSYLVLAHSRLVFDGNDSGLPLAARAVRLRLGRA
ncbi:MAG TPA: TetR/AcrR family transcriptional regulator [Candidatus Limnocylindrales bacterium]|jgi:AcrR family transcriptional regulator